jgi:ribosomal protein S18 acetylase RimI-like enzyme
VILVRAKHTMSAQLVADYQVDFRGIRPLDPRRDLAQVADLIEEAFSGELEPGGVAALRDLRMLARMGPLVGFMSRSDPHLEDVLGGFVWIESGQVVGNVTLQRLDPYGSRWQLANVAVAKAFRGRGIGRALVEAALERIAERRGTWAVLQVRNDNLTALGLYERFGFEPLTEEAILTLPKLQDQLPTVEPLPGFRPFRHEEWQARYQLEVASRTALASWWRPVRSLQYMQTWEGRLGERLWELLGRSRVRRWLVEGEHGLVASLSIEARRWYGTHRLAFTVHPSKRGRLENSLVAYAMHWLADYPRWPVRVEHQGEHHQLIEALQEAGFQLQRNHLAMRKQVT